MDERPTTIASAVRTFWRRFAPLWCVPLVSVPGDAVLEGTALQLWYFWIVSAPFFIYGFFRAAGLWTERRILYRHYAVLAFLLPAVIFVALTRTVVFIERSLAGS